MTRAILLSALVILWLPALAMVYLASSAAYGPDPRVWPLVGQVAGVSLLVLYAVYLIVMIRYALSQEKE